MSQVLITGGTGFIGSNLARACQAGGDHVRILGQANTLAEQQNLHDLQSQGLQVTKGTIVDPQSVRKALEGVEVVYHLAAAQHEAGKPDEHFRAVNVTGTMNMLEASVTQGVRCFLYGSSIGVYQADRGTVHDNSPTVPDNIYGATKLEAEAAVRGFADRLPAVIIRISETYGPGDRRLLKLFRAVQKQKYVHIGRSENLHHPVYIADLIAALRLAATSPQACGQTMVIPGYETVTSRQMAVTVSRVLGVPPPTRTLPLTPLWAAATVMELALRPFGIQPPLHRRRMHFFTKSFSFSGELAHRLLGYAPQVSFDEGVRRTADWYRQTGLLN